MIIWTQEKTQSFIFCTTYYIVVWERGEVFFLPSHSCVHKTWGKNQTTLCSSVEDVNSQVREGTETRIPSDDSGISSGNGSGESPLPPRLSQFFGESPIRLSTVRSLLYNNKITLEDAITLFQTWREVIEFMLLQLTQIEPSLKGSVEWENKFIAVKCSKRGNDVYRHRVRESLSSIQECVPDLTFFNPLDRDLGSKKVKTPLILVTLTFDTKQISLYKAWEEVGREFNKWLSGIRKKFGKVSVLRTWESTKNGYPHIHVVLLFHERQFSVFRWKSKFRIREKAEFSKNWHSHVDVSALHSLKKAVRYVTKYITKDLFSEKGKLTMTLLWLFRKRSFSISRDFQSIASRLDYSMHNSNQVSFSGKKLTQIVWRFLGIFTKSELKIEEEVWHIEIPKKIVQELVKI